MRHSADLDLEESTRSVLRRRVRIQHMERAFVLLSVVYGVVALVIVLAEAESAERIFWPDEDR